MPIDRLSAFRDDGLLNVIVESPRASTVKIKFDPVSGLMMLSRPLPSGFAYPCDWGFIAGTRAPDGDPFDAALVWDSASYPGLLVPSRIIGALRVEQSDPSGKRQRNDRIIAIPGKALRHANIAGVNDLPERTRKELEHFFSAVVAFENKQLQLLGWSDASEAEQLVRAAVMAR
jgi:inorganic pyrophosphatase